MTRAEIIKRGVKTSPKYMGMGGAFYPHMYRDPDEFDRIAEEQYWERRNGRGEYAGLPDNCPCGYIRTLKGDVDGYRYLFVMTMHGDWDSVAFTYDGDGVERSDNA